MAVSIWIQAARLRTLPLAFASILLGSLLAAGMGGFRWEVTVLALLTTLALQVLSNYANDLGDTLHGADHAERKGPKRAVQAGHVTVRQMRTAVIITSILAFVLGVSLLIVAFSSLEQIFMFLGLGLACIAAAILYTNGKRPYGYAGLGDISVLIFFGLVGVLGSYALYGMPFKPILVMPALSAGLLATGVLNVNNLRDVVSDKAAGKNSIPVRLGFEGGKRYHTMLIAGALILNYSFMRLLPMPSPFKYLWLIPAIGLVVHARKVQNLSEPHQADPLLKQLALLSLATDVLVGLGFLLASKYPLGITIS